MKRNLYPGDAGFEYLPKKNLVRASSWLFAVSLSRDNSSSPFVAIQHTSLQTLRSVLLEHCYRKDVAQKRRIRSSVVNFKQLAGKMFPCTAKCAPFCLPNVHSANINQLLKRMKDER
jgi:hypothetical protein